MEDQAGSLGPVKMPRPLKYLRFRLSEVEAWLAQHRREVSNGDVVQNGADFNESHLGHATHA